MDGSTSVGRWRGKQGWILRSRRSTCALVGR
ncbi:Protein CBG27710 [Caenorhabditis briggsae]|uniref:Protein CBG27710 n=1 Tax=Caenorhabditis briggsae TaxID=6238 RepID=B6IJ08_CAEBR|nr:Protein CBG27710 [Caenorhabditis briggsae]CAR99988.1 Protein CBG27710 [Caenorhabditis briggsae]